MLAQERLGFSVGAARVCSAAVDTAFVARMETVVGNPAGPEHREAAEISTSAPGMAEGVLGAAPVKEPLAKAILQLQAQQAELREEKKRIAKELRNAMRKKRRLKNNARQLTDEDLVAVLLMRREAKEAILASGAAVPSLSPAGEAASSSGAAPAAST
jgi:molecular chaperone GrpE (heat shock protein)